MTNTPTLSSRLAKVLPEACDFESYGQLAVALIAVVSAAEFTQRTDVNIGVSEGARDKDGDVDNIMRGMPDKIMMRNRLRDALADLSAAIGKAEG